MQLIIDTSNHKEIYLKIIEKEICDEIKISSHKQQAEQLLPNIEKLLEKHHKNLNDIKEIMVNNHGDSFTALRIGVLTANTLAYALNISVKSIKNKDDSVKFKDFTVIEPKYSRPPNIT